MCDVIEVLKDSMFYRVYDRFPNYYAAMLVLVAIIMNLSKNLLARHLTGIRSCQIRSLKLHLLHSYGVSVAHSTSMRIHTD